MTKKNNNKIISVVHPICCGLDVHKDMVSACIIITEPDGEENFVVQEFSTFTDDLFRLKSWLLNHSCTVIAMESTSVYWRPVHNVLEDTLQVILVNARHVKNVPGRKTDISDSMWLASLLRIGVLKASFIPEKHIRQIRELVTLRKSYIKTLADYKRRVHKLFETANIKISSVVSNLFGKTGRNLINRLIDTDIEIKIEHVEACAEGSLRRKVPELFRSIQGFFEVHHCFQVKMMMQTINHLEGEIKAITKRLDDIMLPHKEMIEQLDRVPGIDKKTAQSIIGHIGDTLTAFRSDKALASWGGLCPGNNESAGKRKSGRSPVRKHLFKELMIEIAWAAVRTKGTYYKDKYHRLKTRRGPKRAVVAIAHRITKAVYHIIKHGKSFVDLGDAYLMSKSTEKRIKALKLRARHLGYNLVPVEAN
ncbi:MAG: IS110 family transposase [Deltaproteobacteria bacterium]|nr:IS110 family transposase [Deltaproteobacteria bacterium]